ncbi:MAG: hypothetical protein DRI56_07770 [Chloroflexota bacterium]|nr:MAG: hypothetical protein DRI56_07770 [Chloroflexota bacterium]
MTKRRRKEHGQSLTEAAIALPLIVLVLMGIINMGVYGLVGMNASNAANYGARRASVAQTNVQAKALSYTEARLAQVSIGTYEVTVSGGGGRGELIQIVVHYSIPNYFGGLMALFHPSPHMIWDGYTVSYFRQEGW